MQKMSGAFTRENVTAVLTCAKQGGSQKDIARRAGVSYHTLMSWLKLGRRDPESALGEFAAAYYHFVGKKEVAMTEAEKLRVVRDSLDALGDE